MLALGFVLVWCFGHTASPSTKAVNFEEEGEQAEEPTATAGRNFTLQQLHLRDGIQRDGRPPLPLCVSLKGEVFDVSAAAGLFGPSKPYSIVTGHDASINLAKLSFDERDLDTMAWDALPEDEARELSCWADKLRTWHCPSVGRLVGDPAAAVAGAPAAAATELAAGAAPAADTDASADVGSATAAGLRSFSAAELRKHDGSGPTPPGYAMAPILVAINGTVFDVSFGGQDLYSPGRRFHKLAGKDITAALAQMALEPAGGGGVAELTPDEAASTSEWERSFRETAMYPVVGILT
ncbi:unnamed protein product [Phaeothamnion confervicola]